MHNRLKISQHKHSGRLRPHEYTSYVPLFFLLLIVGAVLAAFSIPALASGSPPPQSGSVGLTGTMPGTPPSVAAHISSPTNGQHFSTTPVTVSGTCSPGVLVEVYKNDIFAGSSFCDKSGAFSLQVDLLIGQNTLVARVYNALNQVGPDSNSVSVFYDAVPPVTSALSALDFSSSQLLLNTNAVYRGTFPGQALNVPISIIGGTPPFAVNVQWGDSGNSVIPRGDNLAFNATHTYKTAGTYEVTIQATDSQQRVAFLTVAAVVNGQPPVAAASTNAPKTSVNKLLVLWPLYAIITTLVVSFWMGEQREKHMLNAASATHSAI